MLFNKSLVWFTVFCATYMIGQLMHHLEPVLFYIVSPSSGLSYNNINILGFTNYCKLFYLTGFSNYISKYTYVEGNFNRWDVDLGTEQHYRDITSLLVFLSWLPWTSQIENISVTRKDITTLRAHLNAIDHSIEFYMINHSTNTLSDIVLTGLCKEVSSLLIYF